MATCLYAGVLTDTGSFCYEGTDAHAFELARELVGRGADPAGIAREVYFSNPLSKMLLLGAALSNLRREGRLAWLWVTRDDMIRTGAAEEDCEGIVNYAIAIGGVEAAVLLRELPDRRVRLSLRSKGQLDVARIAARLGGGGHLHAGGCTLAGPLREATETILGNHAAGADDDGSCAIRIDGRIEPESGRLTQSWCIHASGIWQAVRASRQSCLRREPTPVTRMNESPAGNVTETSKDQQKTETSSGDSPGPRTPRVPGTLSIRRKSRGLLSRIAARGRDCPVC